MRTRHLYKIVGAVLLLAAVTRAAAQSLNSTYNAQRPVVIVCDWDKPPYEFLDDKGRPAGSNIDVLEAVFKQLNIPCRFVMKEWSIALKTFQRGDADLILANARRYRKAPYVVSDNVINYNRIRVAMFSDTTQMVTMKQLEREGAVFKPGDYSAQYFQDTDSASLALMEYQTPKVALLGLINGDYRYYVWGEEPLKWKIKELNLEGITLNDVSIPISEIHVIGRDRELVEAVDDQFSRLKQSGEVEELQNRWFHPERVKGHMSPLVVYIILGVLLLAAFFYLFNRLAKAQVRSMTRHVSETNDMILTALHMGDFIVMEYDIANDLVVNRYGHLLPDKGLTLEQFTSRIHPDQQQEFTTKMKRLLDGRERKFELNKRWLSIPEASPDGQEEAHWLNFQGHAIVELDANGRPAYVVNAIHDLTHDVEEVRAEHELAAKYEKLQNLPFICVSFYTSDGFLISLNDSMKQLCQFDVADNERFWRTVCMFDVPYFRNVCLPNQRDDVHFCQYMKYPEMGIDNCIESHIMPLLNADGEIVNYYITTVDATEERRGDYEMHQLRREEREMERQIAQKKERLAYILCNSERYILRSSIADETISFFRSPVAPEHVLRFDEFLAMIEERERRDIQRILSDTETRELQQYTVHLVKPIDGQQDCVFIMTFSPIVDADGHIVGHEGMASNITTLYNARKHLIEVTRRAKDSVRLKSGFMASMTHELRTPLNAIVGFTSVLEALGDSEERGEYVRIIRNSSDMLQRLINDIIEASSLTDGPTSLMPMNVNFAASFEDICLTLQSRVQDAGLSFVKDNPYTTFMTTLDIGRVQQVMTNFVTNAVKFTKKGHIRLGYRYDRHGLYVFCEDTGIGIPRDKQEQIFERFVKLDEFVQGTGMGLAICKSIVERCGGEIGVESDGPDLGSTFWFWIPCERRLS